MPSPMSEDCGSSRSTKSVSTSLAPTTAATSLQNTPDKRGSNAEDHSLQAEELDMKVQESVEKGDLEEIEVDKPGPEADASEEPHVGIEGQAGIIKSRTRDLDEISNGSSVDYMFVLGKNNSGEMSNKDLENKSKKRVGQHVHHVYLAERRVSRIEDRLRVLEKREPSPEPPPEDETPVRQPAIPKLNVVDWMEFKELRKRGESHHAIDVLNGEPILFHHRHKAAVTTPNMVRTLTDNSPISKELPERIRINSIPLLRILRKITANSFDDSSERPLVILRPFKPLIYHRKELKETLISLEGRWGIPLRDCSHDEEEKDNDYSALVPDREMPVQDDTATKKDDDGEEVELHESAEARDDLRCLVNLLDDCLGHLNDRLDDKKEKNPKVQFQDLWHLFEPGTFVFSRKGPQTLWRVRQATGGRHYLSGDTSSIRPNTAKASEFTLDCYYIDFDGKEWGPCQHRFGIRPFEGWREVTSLDLYPVRYGETSPALLAKLNARGKNFVEASGIRHMYCKGRTLIRSPAGRAMFKVSHPEDVDSPVMVDFDRTLQFNPEWRPELSWSDTCESDGRETREMTLHEFVECGDYGNCSSVFCCTNENIVKDYTWDRQRSSDFHEEREKSNENNQTEKAEILQEEWKLLPNRVFGFILRSRKWASLRMDDLSPVKEEKDGFKNLKLPPGHDRVVLGLVQTHFRRRENMNLSEDEGLGFDLVKAKGDLGMTPTQVEQTLELNFQLAQSWGCVLLLDEADVFLAERAKADVKRNALVSVFLRALEYYTGILFLTTNRVGTIDEAFRSRIHVSLLYPPLDWGQTKAIWEHNLDTIIKHKDIAVDKQEVLVYAESLYKSQVASHKVGWNGRQIRNAFQTAVALAEYDSIELATDPKHPARPSLRLEWFKTVARASVEFDEYIKKTLMLSATDYAQSVHWRADMYRGSDPNAKGTWGSVNPAAMGSNIYSQNTNPVQGHPVGPQWTPGIDLQQLSSQGQGQHWQGAMPAFNPAPGFAAQNQSLVGPSPLQAGYNQGFPGPNSMFQGYGQQGVVPQYAGQAPMAFNMHPAHGQPQSMNLSTSGARGTQIGSQPTQPMGLNSMPTSGQQIPGQPNQPHAMGVDGVPANGSQGQQTAGQPNVAHHSGSQQPSMGGPQGYPTQGQSSQPNTVQQGGFPQQEIGGQTFGMSQTHY
ncbi:hypothetical protein FGG08_006268 [Glutinoglossum americanum]|uniref:ATPase AAA-type core domain-containing protein n=1 Tax=Glutinoglossum americanum TaxID=1670608 RepID=A0A9P8I1L6_9PEZI|nr:hypothetical protein FGG08_006268 [Glutinoglossum americanum]